MAYREDIYKSDNFIEHDLKWSGRYGARGEKRSPKKKATPEQIKKQNFRNKVNHIRRLIQKNFYPNDIWATLKYPAGTRKTIKEVETDIKKFQDGMRKEYKKRGEEFKWIKRIEIGRNGGLHAHFIINRIELAEVLMSKHWIGIVWFENIRESGGMEALAEYITKPIPEEVEQLSFIPMDTVKRCAKYSCSRNLDKPEPERKEYKRRTVKKILNDNPKPREGFYIDTASIRIGINPYTGYSYMTYREIRLKPIERKIRPGGMRC